MNAIRTLLALSVAGLVTACANPGTTHAASPSPGMSPGMSTMHGSTAGPAAPTDARMSAMREMHRKMLNAGTPAEREDLMADHLKAMQGGMAMMSEQQAMPGCGMGDTMTMGSPGAAAPMASTEPGKSMPADSPRRCAAMPDRMAAMRMMMDMMADRMPPAPAGK